MNMKRTDTQSEFRHKELSIGAKCGDINRDSLRLARRQLVEGKDFAKKRRAILYSDAGAVRLAGLLGVELFNPASLADVSEPPQKAPVPPFADLDALLQQHPTWVVWRSGREKIKKRHVYIYPEGKSPTGWKEVWILLVRDNHRFRAGFKIPAEYMEPDNALRFRLNRRGPRGVARW